MRNLSPYFTPISYSSHSSFSYLILIVVGTHNGMYLSISQFVLMLYFTKTVTFLPQSEILVCERERVCVSCTISYEALKSV